MGNQVHRAIAGQAAEYGQKNAAVAREHEGGRRQRHTRHSCRGAAVHGLALPVFSFCCFFRAARDSSHDAQARTLPNNTNALITSASIAVSLVIVDPPSFSEISTIPAWSGVDFDQFGCGGSGQRKDILAHGGQAFA